MSEKIETEPLYEHDCYASQQDTYVCSATGLVCKKVSQHFREYRAFIRRLAETEDDRIFLHNEPNLCIDKNHFGLCPVYKNFCNAISKNR